MQTDPQFTYYSYVTWDDLIQCFGNDLVLTVRNYDLYKSSFVKVSSSCFWCSRAAVNNHDKQNIFYAYTRNRIKEIYNFNPIVGLSKWN